MDVGILTVGVLSVGVSSVGGISVAGVTIGESLGTGVTVELYVAGEVGSVDV